MKKVRNFKIIFLLHLPPPVHGSSVVGLSIKESKIINKRFNCFYINLLASHNIEESGTVNLNKLLGFILTWFKILFSIIRNRPNLCYLALSTTGAAFYKDILLVALLKIFKIKRIYHLHNKGIKQNNKIINRIFYSFVFKEADIILLSKRLYPDIKAYVSESRIHICPNGIPDRIPKSKFTTSLEIEQDSDYQYNKQIEVQVNSPQKPVQILFLSNLIESKGAYILLDACANLKKKNILFKCIFIGAENDITAFEFNKRIDQLELSQQVCFKGTKYGIEKEYYFSNADIFAFPTYYHNECFPLVLLEAMTYSLPVISTFNGGISDEVENEITGFLVEKRDVEVFSEKLELLTKSPNIRNQMGNAGRKKYEMEFTLEIFENRLVEIILDVIKKNAVTK